MVWLIIIALLSSADQLIKALIKSLAAARDLPVIDGFFYLTYRVNPGAAWSFLAGQAWGIYLLIAFSAVISLLLLIFIMKSRNSRLQACLAVICGGSVGNLIDRIKDGGVTDYLDFHFGSYVFPTFNLADSLIVCGTIALCLLILFDPALLPAQSGPKKSPAADLSGEGNPGGSSRDH
jgi:signal peptidase II